MHTTALLALLAAVPQSCALSLARPRATVKLHGGGAAVDTTKPLPRRITAFVDRTVFVCGMVASGAVAGFAVQKSRAKSGTLLGLPARFTRHAPGPSMRPPSLSKSGMALALS